MLTFNEAEITAWLAPLVWPFLRILALFSVVPVLSSRAVPVRVKIGLAFLIALAVSGVLPDAPMIGLSDSRALEAVAQQLTVGICMGLAVRFIFAAMELAGEVIGFQMGLNFAAFFDPTINSQSSAMARFFGQITLLLFVVSGGHLMVVVAVVKSFETFPVDGGFLHTLQRLQLHVLGAEIFASALWIALPVMGMLLFANLALGVISRVAPQMNIFAVGFPLTLVIGILGVALTLPALDGPFMRLLERMLALFG
ncbi:MAG: flagellar biosynthetic protein FliR [Rhodoferax sp.]